MKDLNEILSITGISLFIILAIIGTTLYLIPYALVLIGLISIILS